MNGGRKGRGGLTGIVRRGMKIKINYMSIKLRFALMSLLAMLSVVSFFHIDSFVADQHKINYLFWLAGFTFAALAIWNLVIIMKTAGTGPDDE